MSWTDPEVSVLSVVVFALAVGLLVPPASPVVAQSSYDISVPNAVDVPNRDVTVDGDQFTISEVSKVAKGNDIKVHVDAPDETYDINLYNYKSQDVDRRTTTGPSDVSFPTDDLQPGTYYVAVIQSDYRDVYPIVVKGYDVGLDAPGSVEQGESGEMSVPVTATASSGDPYKVQVVVGDELRRINATKTDGTYTATISTGQLSPGDYPVYGVVRGERETEDGRKIILGLSGRQTLTVTESTPTETESSGGGGGGGGTGGGGGAGSGGGAAETATASTTPTATETPTPGPTTAATSSPTVSPMEPSTEPSTSPTDFPTPTPTDNEVITPAATTEPPSTPTNTATATGGQPGFGVVAVVVALVGLLAVRRR